MLSARFINSYARILQLVSIIFWPNSSRKSLEGKQKAMIEQFYN